MSSLQRRGSRYRVVWREGGRGTKQRVSDLFDSKSMAVEFQERLDAHLAAKRPVGGRLVVPWAEIRERWLVTLSGRYQVEARRTLERHTKHWTTTASATPAEMSQLPILTTRAARACLRWSWLHLGQTIDERALHVEPRRVLPRKAPKPLMDDAECARLALAAADWSPGNGALAHLALTYGHRIESLVHLTGAAFDGKTLTLRVKSGDVVNHPLLPSSCAMLRKLATAADAPLFLNHLGKAWKDGRAFASWFHHTFGVGYYQAFKRPAISRMFALGLDAKTIASITGHRTVSLLLNTYAQTNERRQAAAIEALASAVLPGVTSKRRKSLKRP